ncbi:MAG: FG-GAP-like repeat-containing protein, partial [Candidatus Thermoplasmatota archaeon]
NASGGVQWSVPISLPDLPLSTPTLLDVNRDGILDALLGGRNRQVNAHSGADGAVIASYAAGDWAYTASVYDVDGDGVGELFFASDDRNVHAYRASGALLWSNTTTGATFIENSVAIGDVDDDGFADVVTGDDGNSGPEFALNATNGAFTWARDLPAYREGAQTLADLDRDGTLETIVGITTGPVYALRGSDGVILWTNVNATGQASAPAVVDLTNDGIPEIIFTDEAAVYVLDAMGTLLYRWPIAPNDPGYRNLSQQAMDTPAVVDLDGDGTLEVIAATGAGVQAFPTGGLDRDWRTFGYNWNHTHAAGDGTSPDGVPFLEVALGGPTDHPAAGVSWRFRDGVAPWLASGGDFGPVEVAAAGGTGSWSSWNVTAFVNDTYMGTYPDVGLFLTEANEASGALHGFLSSDAADPLRRPRLTIAYTAPGVDPTPRILAAIPNIARPEDSPAWSLDLAGYGADADTPSAELRWNVSGLDPAIVAVTGTNVPGGAVLTFYAQPNAWGSMAVTYWLTDPQGNFASRPAWVNVTPVNDPPTFNPPATLGGRADTPYPFAFEPYATDVDTPPSGLTLASDDPAHVTVSGFNATFLYPASYLNQWAFVGLLLSDGSATVGRVVAVKVTSDNPPVLTRLLPDLTMMEGQALRGVFDLDDYFTDPNNDVLFFSYGYTHLSITIHANHSVDIQAETNWFGSELVTFRGTDTEGALAEDTIVVTVIPVDDPPSLGPVPDLRVRYDANYTFNLDPYISDPDTPSDRINASTSSPFVIVSAHLMTLRYPFALNNTVQPLTIWISDGTSVVSRTILVTVGDDWPPVVQLKMPDRTFPEDSLFPAAYDLRAHFDDPDGTALFYTTGNVSVRVSIDASGLVDLSAEPDFFGTERVIFRATDPQGALAEDSVWITVLPVNDAPVFAPVPQVILDSLAGFVDLLPYLSDVDDNVTTLVLTTTGLNATVVGQGLLFRY